VNDLQVGVCHEIRGRKLSHRIELGKAAAELYANNNEALQGRIDSEIESSDHRAREHFVRYEHSNERSGNLRKLSNSLDIHREDHRAAKFDELVERQSVSIPVGWVLKKTWVLKD
tara:strand:- start:122 stop:466 length:345 start_codon:yes stop_codon:yes gene_type:complete